MEITNPASDAVIATLVEDDATSINEKFQRCQKAAMAWRKKSLDQRIAVVRRFREGLHAGIENAARILTSETGKPLAHSRNEITGTLERIDFFLRHVTPRMEAKIVQAEDGLVEKISFDPLGVIANISAWNYPYFVSTNVIVPALLTGNGVLFKPSEFSTLSGKEIERLLLESGLAADTLQLIVGDGAAGSELLRQDIDGVFFTGSFRTGHVISQALAGRFLKLQLELGGKDPVYVCDDVDVAKAAAAVGDGAFYNAGQSCCAVERIYVHQSIYSEFVQELASFARGLTVGDPGQPDTYIGPLTRSAQLDILEEQVTDALAKGGQLLTGGRRLGGNGNFFPPTVLANANHDMTLMRDESFGPIIGVQSVADDAEACELMGDTIYGLTAAVYCREKTRAEAILQRVDAGSVYWNCCDRVSPYLPWSGRRNSGVGWTLSTMGIDTFLKPKAWHLKDA